MMVEAARQEIISNNMANSETVGFKKDMSLQRSFPQLPVVRTGEGNKFPFRPVIGQLGLGSLVDRIFTSHSQGDLLETGRALDIAILGEGFFVVDTPQGLRYTRSGAFSRDGEKYLVTDQGHRVMGMDGPLRVDDGEMSLDEQGRIYSDGVLQGQLRLSAFTDENRLQKLGGNLFAAAEDTDPIAFRGQTRQGFLETSNVDALQEMVQMMAALRAYETNQRMILAQDEILGKAVNEVGSLR
jgi:flagellar basal-body rod protein FlgG